MELLKKVESAIRNEQLAEAGDRIVVAVSGGPDSMALLHVLFLLSRDFRFQLIVSHVNHGFRVEESEREAETVAAYAAELGVPCEIGRFDLPAYVAETGMNSQAAAREKRYAFLFETAKRHGAGKIALAHNADDQAETMLMRIMRGTGPSGLTGIPLRRTEKNLELIRPLLRIYKSEIERHCAEYGIPVCRDSSNEQRKYFRNVVRLDVLPYLRGYNDKLPESLNRLADMMQAEDDWMDAEARKKFTEFVTVEQAEGQVECSLGANRFAGLHVALQRRLIKLILNYVFSEADLSDYARIETVRSVIVREQGESLSLDLHDRLKLLREYDRVRFVQAAPVPRPYEYLMEGPHHSLRLPEAGMELEMALIGGSETTDPSWRGRGGRDEARFDYELLHFPLSVRSRQPGDRMEPLGLKGTKKVKDMFIDEKMPPETRDRVPLVLDASGRILWIPGVRRSTHATVSETTSRVLVMKVRPIER
ncbi:tRNA lysidine(34) synthetase TilS [Paenibacillus mesophilus]|uniref:tRNA lysidine(34) synthetase TilS n=1 Tax=Paenibacillus mesophilus TaxID=2582849 RepID=UPI00110DA2D2|nr:tRNA lysidine(34) synthetase TilS [Paenibacillus mesophilus]TMV44291.1 tRNA lysidine(34) synthetase TilS [Paenibacillus mesophilus]